MGNVHLTGERNSVTATVGSFISNLPELLGAMALDARCLVAIAEFGDGRYVQFWVEPDGTTSAEVVSNLNIGDAVALSPEDEEALLEMGWCEPVPVRSPNWRVEANEAIGVLRVATLVRRAVYDVLRERPDNVLTLRSFALERSAEGWREVQASTRVYVTEVWDDVERFLRAQ
jgi:hypothetical protein